MKKGEDKIHELEMQLTESKRLISKLESTVNTLTDENNMLKIRVRCNTDTQSGAQGAQPTVQPQPSSTPANHGYNYPPPPPPYWYHYPPPPQVQPQPQPQQQQQHALDTMAQVLLNLSRSLQQQGPGNNSSKNRPPSYRREHQPN